MKFSYDHIIHHYAPPSLSRVWILYLTWLNVLSFLIINNLSPSSATYGHGHMATLWDTGNLPLVMFTKESDSPSLKSHQSSIAPLLGVWPQGPSPMLAGILTASILCRWLQLLRGDVCNSTYFLSVPSSMFPVSSLEDTNFHGKCVADHNAPWLYYFHINFIILSSLPLLCFIHISSYHLC